MGTGYPGFKTAVPQVSLGVNALCRVYRRCWLLFTSSRSHMREEKRLFPNSGSVPSSGLQELLPGSCPPGWELCQKWDSPDWYRGSLNSSLFSQDITILLVPRPKTILLRRDTAMKNCSEGAGTATSLSPRNEPPTVPPVSSPGALQTDLERDVFGG